MREHKKKKKVLMLCVCMVLAMEATGCSSVKENESNDTQTNAENNESNDTQTNAENTEQGNQSTGGGDTSTSLFANTNLQGNVVEFSDLEISLSIATTTTDENGGEIMAEAAPGMEAEDELVHITYGENVIVQILTMDSASQTQVSLLDADKSSIKKQTSVLVFGSCQDTYHWTADKVVIVRWQ